MATITTSQQAPIRVATDTGQSITVFNASFAPAEVAGTAPAGNDVLLVPLTAGTGVLTVTTNDGRSGTLEVTVTNPPLLVTLGDAIPK